MSTVFLLVIGNLTLQMMSLVNVVVVTVEIFTSISQTLSEHSRPGASRAEQRVTKINHNALPL